MFANDASEMARRIRAFDWAGTPLGPRESWSPRLATLVDLLLDSRQPAYLAWGPQLTSLYNDGYLPFLPDRHPAALGKSFFDVWPEIADEYRPVIAATLRGEAHHFVDRLVVFEESGQRVPHWFTFAWTPVRGDDGRVAGFYCNATETTATVRATETTEQRYRSLFNSIDEGFCIIQVGFDGDGKPNDYQFVEVNGAFVEQTGLENAIGRWVSQLVPGHEKHWYEIYGNVALTGEPTRFTQPAQALGRWYSVYAFRVGDPAEHLVAVLFADITERTRAQQELQSSNRQKDQFLATLAHELRNPLAPLRTGLHLARRLVDASSPAQPTLEMMERQLRHLVRLVDDLLDVARIDSGKLALRMEPVDVVRALEASVEAARDQIETRRHLLTLDAAEPRHVVLGDPDRLSQIFTNLLSNAAKYTDPGGRIDIRVRNDDDAVLTTVTDTGIGIPREEVERVFELFSQVRSHQSHTEGGLGIGLSLVKRLVEMHGGRVDVESAGPGQGSSFSVRIPLHGPTDR